MPEFAPWYKKKLLQAAEGDPSEEEELAVDQSSGFFGDVFDFMDEGFNWSPAPEPEPIPTYDYPAYDETWQPAPVYEEPDMGIGAAIGNAWGDIQWAPEQQGIGSALGDAFGNNWFTDQMAPAVEPWGWQNGATEDFWVADREYVEPAPEPLMNWDAPRNWADVPIGQAIADSVGNWGLSENFGEPIEQWGIETGLDPNWWDLALRPDPTGWGIPGMEPTEALNGIYGDAVGSGPEPDMYTNWQAGRIARTWPGLSAMGDSATEDFMAREGADNAARGVNPWDDVIDKRGDNILHDIYGQSQAVEDKWRLGLGVVTDFLNPFEGDKPYDPWDLRGEKSLGAKTGLALSNVAEQVSSFSPEPIPGIMDSFRDIGGAFASGLRAEQPPYVSTGWAPNGLEQSFWDGLTPDEKFYTLQQLGLSARDIPAAELAALNADDRMSLEMDDIQGRDLMADLSSVGGGLMHGAEVGFNQIPQLFYDAVKEPVQSVIEGSLYGGFPTGPTGVSSPRTEFEMPLDDTVANIQEADDPWDFAELQSETYKERNPWYSEIIGQTLNPGGGLLGTADDLPRALQYIDDIADTLQGGKVLGAVGDIPGAGAVGRNVLAPAAIGGTGGGLTEAIFDPEFTDPITGEVYDPGLLESILAGAGLGVGVKAGGVPFRAGIEETTEFVLPKELAGAKPRTAYGSKKFTVSFQDDLDKALYIVRDEKNRSKSDGKYMEALREYFPEESDAQIRARGKEVAGALKEQARKTEIPAGNKVGELEITPVARAMADVEPPTIDLQPWQDSIDALTPPSTTMDEFYGLPDESEVPDFIPRGDWSSESLDTGKGLSWEPMLEDIADDATDLAIPAPPQVEKNLQSLLDQVNLQSEWLATTDRAARRSAWYDQSQSMYDAAYDQAITRGLRPSEAANMARAATRGFNAENGLESLTLTPEARDAITTRVDALVREGRETPDKRSMVGRVLRDWANGKSPNPSELRDFRRIITGVDVEKPVSRFASETVPGTTKTVTDVVDEVAQPKLTPEEQQIIGANDEYVIGGNNEPPVPNTQQAIEEGDNLNVNEDVEEWLRRNVPEFDGIGLDEKVSRTQRIVGGALNNRLADTMTQRGRNLFDLLVNERGVDADTARGVVDEQFGKYLDARLMDKIEIGGDVNPRDAMMERALTALRMGDFNPVDPTGAVTVAKEVGAVAPGIRALQGANNQWKNMTYGILDASAIVGNALPALQAGWAPFLAGYFNRMLRTAGKGVDLSEATRYAELAGLQRGARAQDQITPGAGTLIGGAGKALEDFGAKKAGGAFKGLDRPFVKWNEVLEKAQFDYLLDRTFRKPIYEGNLLLLKMAKQDINDADVQRAAARMANAVTSAAPAATGNTRRATEGALLNTARFTRAQGDLLLAASKLLNPRANRAERVIAASTIASMAASIYGAYELSGGHLELDPTDPDFGQLILPGGNVVTVFPQKQLANVLIDTGDALVDIAQGKGGADELYQSWAQFLMGRASPILNTPAKALGVGFDPKQGGWEYPGIPFTDIDGKGGADWGSTMTPFEKALNLLPVPTGLTGNVIPMLRGDKEKGGTATVGLNTIGASSFKESELDKALEAEGLAGVDDLRAYYREKYPKESESRIREFYQKYPEARREDEEITAIREQKAKASANFERSGNADTVGEWRERMAELADQQAGIFMTKDIPDGKRPKEDGAAQWIYDYNKTFRDSKEDAEDPLSPIDSARLEKLQTEFWDDHKDPAVRKEVIAYQLGNASTDAEKLYIEDIARLNGFDPKTGKALTWGMEDKPMPNYFDMERYSSYAMKNDETKEFLAAFENWRQGLSGKKADIEKDDLIKIYISDEEDAATRPSGKNWTPAAIADAQNYGKPSKETAQFKAYRKEMEAELMWFNDKQHWNHIRDAHEEE